MKYIRFYGSNGYCGCEYEEYVAFEDDITEAQLDEYSNELCDENAETYEYVETGWGESFESEEDQEYYYESARDYSGWDYVSKEEYEENT